MKPQFSLLSTLFCLLLLWVVSCKKTEDPVFTPTPGGGTTTKSSAKAVTGFTFSALSPTVTSTIDAMAKTISATVASSTDVTKLVPTITVSDKATVSPASGVAQDFSKAVTYMVTAEDGTMQAYTATVILDKPVVYVQNDILLCGNNDKKLYALDAETGVKKWEFQTGKLISVEPTVVDGVVYFGNYEGKFYALDLKTGAKKWDYLFDVNGFSTSSPVVSGGLVYFGTGIQGGSSGHSYVYALEANTGKMAWRFQTSATPSWSSDYPGGSPAVVNGTVYISTTKFVYALEAIRGTKKWGFELPDGRQGSGGSVAVANGLVYFGNDRFYALDAETGVIKWQFDETPPLGTFVCDPTIINGLVLATSSVITQASRIGKLFALDAQSGAKKWEFVNDLIGGVTVYNNVAYIDTYNSITSTGGKIIALDLIDRSKKWEFSLGNDYTTFRTPTPANGFVYVTNDGDNNSFNPTVAKSIYAIDITTGKKKWEFSIGTTQFYSPPVVVDKNGKTFNSSKNGTIQ